MTIVATHYEITPSLLARFSAKVDTSGGPDACWPWTGSTRATGYGQINSGGHSGVPIKAHRLAYAIEHGVWPEAVLHSCDNPPCCNPAHLFSGDQATNLADMRAKGRQASGPDLSAAIKRRIPRGEQHYASLLTDAQRAEILRLYQAGGVTYDELGARFGVTGGAIGKLCRPWRQAQGVRRKRPPASSPSG